jgi:elongation factor 1-beta
VAAQMGRIKVVYKVFPEDIVESFDDLKKQVENCLLKDSEVEGYGEEPIAFGLKALLVQVAFPEEETGIVDTFETELGKISGVSQVQTVMVRRTSR